MSTNKMAEIVDSEAAPVDTFVPEARLEDNGRRKLIAFYKEKPILWEIWSLCFAYKMKCKSVSGSGFFNFFFLTN